MVIDTLSEENARSYLEDNRIHMIADLTCRRIRNLETLAMSSDRRQTIDRNDEVEKTLPPITVRSAPCKQYLIGRSSFFLMPDRGIGSAEEL